MNINKFETIVAMLYAHNSSPIKGYVRFQYLLYFYLKQRSFIDQIKMFDFSIDKYGPCSYKVRDILYALLDKGIISIKTIPSQDYMELIRDDEDLDLGPIEENCIEVYQLTEKGKEIGSKIKSKYPGFFEIKVQQIKKIFFIKYSKTCLFSLDIFKEQILKLSLRQILIQIWMKYSNEFKEFERKIQWMLDF
jgi:uncharacterized protein YwgA